MKRKHALTLAILITALIFINTFEFNSEKSTFKSHIKRVIDGDTIELESGQIIRLTNINTPERGEEGYEEAKNYLSGFLDVEVEIESTGTDKYKRTLGNVYSDGNYLNLEIVKKGLGTKYLVDEGYGDIFLESEDLAIDAGLGLWKKSEYSECVNIELHNEKTILMENNCKGLDFYNFVVREEGRKRYKFEKNFDSSVKLLLDDGVDNEFEVYWNEPQLLKRESNTIYLLDKNSNLVSYIRYGY